MSSSSLRRRGQLAALDNDRFDESDIEVSLNVISSATATSSSSGTNSTSSSNSPIITSGSASSPTSSSTKPNIFGHYVSPCEYRVSNDPLLVSEETQCDATIYGCVRDHTFLLQSKEEVKELQLNYDYDMYYEFNQEMDNFPDMVEFLEGTMLEHLATLLDLKRCPPDMYNAARLSGLHTRQRQRDRRQLLEDEQQPLDISTSNNHQRILQGFTEDQKAVIIAINSQPDDVESTDYECMVPPENDIQCTSMRGRMIVYVEHERVPETAEATIQSAVLAAIKSGMDTNVYVKDAIRNLVYIDRSTPDITEFGPEEMSTEPSEQELAIAGASEQEKPKDSSANQKIGLGAAAAGFLVLVAIIGLFISRRSRKVESSHRIVENAALDDEDGDAAFEGMGDNSKRGRKLSPKRVIVKNLSCEGSEIPGSLAAKDALALKPQFRRTEDGNIEVLSNSQSGSVTSESLGPSTPSTPSTPPLILRSKPALAETIKATALPPKSSESPESSVFTKSRSRSRSTSPTNSNIEPPFETPPRLSMPPVPLSPVRNEKSGTSPSAVSPKRLPSTSLNQTSQTHLSSRSNSQNSQVNSPYSTRIDDPELILIDDLVAHVDSTTSHSGKRGETIDALRKIAYSQSSGSAAVSFQDTDSYVSVESRLKALARINFN